MRVSSFGSFLRALFVLCYSYSIMIVVGVVSVVVFRCCSCRSCYFGVLFVVFVVLTLFLFLFLSLLLLMLLLLLLLLLGAHLSADRRLEVKQ